MAGLLQVRLGQVHPQQLITLEHILAAVDLNPEKLRHITAIVAGSADDQNVVIVQEFFYNPDLRVALRTLGHWRTAVALEVLADAHMAWDAVGLTIEQRTDRLGRLERMFKLLLAGRTNLVSGELARHHPQHDFCLLARHYHDTNIQLQGVGFPSVRLRHLSDTPCAVQD
jgi:hypothetical protein